MGLWSVITPAAGQNLIINPSIELATTGYTAQGTNTVAQDDTAQKFGAYSLKCTYQNTLNLWAYVPTGLSASTKHYIYAWVWIPSGWNGGDISLDLSGYTGISGEIVNHKFIDGTSPEETWIYIETEFTLSTDTTGTIYLVLSSAPSAGKFIYFDGLNLLATVTPGTHLDGEQPGCSWDGAEHSSTSSRSGQARSGGEIINLADYDIKIRSEAGIGVPPISHNVQAQAQLPGALFNSRKVLPRTLDIRVAAAGADYAGLHKLRQDLWEAIKPDLVAEEQPFILRYTGSNADIPLDLFCQYDSGLEMGDPDMYLEEFNLRVIAYDPFFYELGNQAISLDSRDTLGTVWPGILRKNLDTGQWDDMGAGTPTGNGPISAVLGQDGKIYIAGDFTNWDGITGANYAAAYDPSTDTWARMGGSGDFTGIVDRLLVAPDGKIYAGGNFTNCASIAAADYVAVYDPSANTWAAVAAGGTGRVYALAIGHNGILYIGGNFSNWDGDGSSDMVVSWDGSNYNNLDVGMDSIVYDLAVLPSGNVVAGGAFVSAGGTTRNRIAEWDGTDWLAVGPTAALNAAVRAVEIAPNGDIFIGGDFYNVNGIAEADYVARWNGGSWEALGAGVNNVVEDLALGPDGLLYVGGAFTVPAGTAADRLLIWNGSTWAPIDFNVIGNSGINGVMVARTDPIIERNYEIIVLGDSRATGSVDGAAGDTTVNNRGTRASYPYVTIERSGGYGAEIKSLINHTTGATLFIDYSLRDGEKLTIDLRPYSRKIVSNFYGSVPRAVLENSDFTDFKLLPGDNIITCYVWLDGGTITALMYWDILHWAADGVAV